MLGDQMKTLEPRFGTDLDERRRCLFYVGRRGEPT